MEPIQDDPDLPRTRLRTDGTQEELDVFDRLVAERDRLREDRDRADNAYMHNLSRLADLADERDRLIQALERIAEAGNDQTNGWAQIAVEALTKTTEEETL